MPRGHYILMTGVGVAVVDPQPEQEDTLHVMAAQEPSILAMEPERIVSAMMATDLDGYLRGWRDAVEALSSKLLVPGAPPGSAMAAQAAAATWGLGATRVPGSTRSGQGVRIAILDTGLDVGHPDFVGRQITTKNFVGDGAPFHDGVGHGTHCAGTAAGPLSPGQGPRYGIASQVEIFSGRVLDDNGRGGDANILQGIDWAVGQGCDVISLSLGAPWVPGDPPYSTAYETAIQHALGAGCLVVIAAGNEADNPQYVGAVGTPGNSPSALTVAAIDSALATASFSDRATPDAVGVKAPDLAAPGVDIYSAWPVAKGGYNTISGTSMATPHVAGIAALLAQGNPGIRGQALKTLVLGQCRALPDQSARRNETGSGLVQAPTG
jgi:subtilisin family serine protease